jgi:hypothetical protein
MFYNYYTKIDITNRKLVLFLYFYKNLVFSRLSIGFIDNLKFKANIKKGEIYLCRMISTEVKKRCVIEKRIKHLNKGRNLK